MVLDSLGVEHEAMIFGNRFHIFLDVYALFETGATPGS